MANPSQVNWQEIGELHGICRHCAYSLSMRLYNRLENLTPEKAEKIVENAQFECANGFGPCATRMNCIFCDTAYPHDVYREDIEGVFYVCDDCRRVEETAA